MQSLLAGLLGSVAGLDRLLAYLGGGLLVLAVSVYVLPGEWSCKLAAALVGLPEQLVPAPIQPPADADKLSDWLRQQSDWLRQQEAWQTLTAGTCWYHWSSSQRAVLGTAAIVASIILGALTSALTAPLGYAALGIYDLLSNLRRCRPTPLQDVLPAVRKSYHWLIASSSDVSTHGSQENRNVRPSWLSIHENLQIMLRCLAASIIAIAASIIVMSIEEFFHGRHVLSAFCVGLFLFALFVFALYAMVRVYYDGLTIRFAPLLADAARTGDRELLDDCGRLPQWFADRPERWFCALVRRRYPQPSAQQLMARDRAAGSGEPPARAD